MTSDNVNEPETAESVASASAKPVDGQLIEDLVGRAH